MYINKMFTPPPLLLDPLRNASIICPLNNLVNYGNELISFTNSGVSFLTDGSFFNNDSRITISSIQNFNDFSIGVWAKFNSSTLASQVIWNTGPGGVIYPVYSAGYFGGTLNKFFFYRNTTDGTGAQINGEYAIVLDMWYFMVWNSMSQFYLNSNYFGNCKHNGIATTSFIVIGSWANWTTGRYFNGTLSNFFLVKRILSDKEIKYLYKLGPTPYTNI